MGNLWLVILIAGIVITGIFLALRFSGLLDRIKFSLANIKLAEDAYAPLLMLEDIGQKCLSQIGNSAIELILMWIRTCRPDCMAMRAGSARLF